MLHYELKWYAFHSGVFYFQLSHKVRKNRISYSKKGFTVREKLNILPFILSFFLNVLLKQRILK